MNCITVDEINMKKYESTHYSLWVPPQYQPGKQKGKDDVALKKPIKKVGKQSIALNRKVASRNGNKKVASPNGNKRSRHRKATKTSKKTMMTLLHR